MDYQTYINEARNLKDDQGNPIPVSDQDIANAIRKNGVPEDQYKHLLPQAKFGESKVPEASAAAGGFDNVLGNLVNGTVDFFSKHPLATALTSAGTAATTAATAAYLYGKRKGDAKTETPAQQEITPHQQRMQDIEHQIATEKARELKIKNDLSERQLNPVAQTDNPIVTTPEVPPQTNITVQDLQQRAAQGIKPPTPPVAEAPIAQPAQPEVAPEVIPLAGKVDDTTMAMAKVATGPVEPLVGPAPNLVGPVKPPEGWKGQYKKSVENPIGPGAFNHLANNFGVDEAAKTWESVYGKNNVTYDQMISDLRKAQADIGPQKPLAPGEKPGGSFGKPRLIPEYIKGSASPEAMGYVAGNALGAANIASKLKNKDYSGAGYDAFTQLLSNLAPKLGIGASLMTPTDVSSGTLDSPEAKALFDRVKKKQKTS